MMVVARGPHLSAPSLKAGHPAQSVAAVKTVVIRMILLVNTVLGSLGPRRPRGQDLLYYSLSLSRSPISHLLCISSLSICLEDLPS